MNFADFAEHIHRQVHKQWMQAGSRFGITHSEYEYLRAIALQENKPTDPKNHGQHLHDVVAQMGVTKASASAMVLKLEEAGLVKRIQCQMDARAQHILVTEAGREHMEKGARVFAEAAKQVLAGLDNADRTTLAAEFATHPKA